MKRRHFLRDKESRLLLDEYSHAFGEGAQQFLGSKPQFEIVEIYDKKIYLVDEFPLLIRTNEGLIPTFFFDALMSFLPKIVVDMGALPHLCNGSDLMAPGIKEVKGTFKERSLLVIIDEKHAKPVAIGKSLFDSETIKKLKQGKVLENLHYVGDQIWNLTRNMAKSKT